MLASSSCILIHYKSLLLWILCHIGILCHIVINLSCCTVHRSRKENQYNHYNKARGTDMSFWSALINALTLRLFGLVCSDQPQLFFFVTQIISFPGTKQQRITRSASLNLGSSHVRPNLIENYMQKDRIGEHIFTGKWS